MLRKNGISVMIACQNEESLVAASVLSFLRLGDEIIVVDNGSTDRTKEQVREVAAAFPDKVRFFDRPDLTDLWQNRQAAFEHTRYRWIVRADSDYICYTSGEWDAIHLRHWLLSISSWPPRQIMVGQPTVSGDFRHRSRRFGDFEPQMPRVYSWVPGMRFARLRRWEGVRYPPLLARLVKRVRWDRPVWLHCDIKDDVSYLLRSERTNWRERGEFARWPTVESYVRDVRLGGAEDRPLQGYAVSYFVEEISPRLKPLSPGELVYPELVQSLMAQGVGYRILREGAKLRRLYGGPPDVARLSAGAKHVLEGADRECLPMPVAAE